jgi:amino acid adenylation domain-containing protein
MAIYNSNTDTYTGSVEEMVQAFNDTACSFDEFTTIQEIFEQQVEKSPDATAVICNGESLTYAALNTKANALAHHLRQAGVGREVIVGILCERSFDMMIGILGIIKAGGAYLPLSTEDPESRLDTIINDSGISHVVVQNKYRAKLTTGANIVVLDDFCHITSGFENPVLINKSTDLMYVIYTSGSTGTPKGVMIEQRSLINRLQWMQRAYPICSQDVILQKTPYNFDVSVWELFWWFMQGASVCFLMPAQEKNPITLIDEIEKTGITVMHFVPSLLGVFLEYISEKKEKPSLDSLRLVFSSGEALPPRYTEQFRDILNASRDKKLVNLYGPTEATVDVTHFDCTEGPVNNKIPIGKPISNTQIYICKEDNSLADIGEAGELLIGGEGVARGYLNREELTAEKFIPDVYGGSGRLYKTGDLARWWADGNIEYIQRIDNQVKIRGLRIELSEIEVNLSLFPGIKHCIVLTRQYSESVTVIVAYYTSAQPIEVKACKSFLGKLLPGYMVPGQFIRLDAIPINANGKADRKALSAMINNTTS